MPDDCHPVAGSEDAGGGDTSLGERALGATGSLDGGTVPFTAAGIEASLRRSLGGRDSGLALPLLQIRFPSLGRAQECSRNLQPAEDDHDRRGARDQRAQLADTARELARGRCNLPRS